MNINFYLACMILLFLGSCSTNNSSSTVKTSSVVEIGLKVRSVGKEVGLGKYYPFIGGDSILVSRLDFYLQGFSAIANNSSYLIDSVSLMRLSNGINRIYRKSEMNPLKIDSVSFLCGLDDILNASNPNTFPDSMPLSSSKNMYWTDWSKYRYIVFEGNIKKSNGQLLPFSFHTGLSYREKTRIYTGITLDVNSPKTYTLVLNIDRIFTPNDGLKIEYLSGELQAHSDPLDAILTAKFAKNFSKAFTFE